MHEYVDCLARGDLRHLPRLHPVIGLLADRVSACGLCGLSAQPCPPTQKPSRHPISNDVLAIPMNEYSLKVTKLRLNHVGRRGATSRRSRGRSHP